MKIKKQDIRKIRLYKSGLVKPFADIKECAGNLFGIQAQAQQFGEISIFNRVCGVTQEKLQNLYKKHELIKIWGQRMTVHMYNAADWKTVHQVYGSRSNFVIKGWEDKDGWLEKLINKIDKLTAKKPALKKDIASLIEKNVPHIKNEFRDYSVILQATLEGVIFGIPDMPQTKYFAHRNKCIKDKDFSLWKKDIEKSTQKLILNYFKNYGPATLNDFCHWSGLNKSEAKAAFEKIEDKLFCDRIDGGAYYIMKGDKDIESFKDLKTAEVKLLGKFDPLFVAYCDKSWIADAKQQKAIWRPAGHVEAVVIINGDLAGTWRYEMKGSKLNFNAGLFSSVSKEDKKKISLEAEKLSGFLSKKLGKVTFKKVTSR